MVKYISSLIIFDGWLEAVMAQQSFQFTMQTGPNPGKVFLIQKTETAIGRYEQSDIFILDSGISRHHAVLSLQGSNYVIKDLGSTNGTFINDQRIAGPHAIKPGDIILLGDKVRLIFNAASYDPDVTIQRRRPVAAGEPEAFIPGRPQPPQPVPLQPRPVAAPKPPVALKFDPNKYLAEDEKSRKMVPWIAGGIGCFVIVCILLLLIFLYIDSQGETMWCQVLPFLYNCR
jgi:hypothetical protein